MAELKNFTENEKKMLRNHERLIRLNGSNNRETVFNHIKDLMKITNGINRNVLFFSLDGIINNKREIINILELLDSQGLIKYHPFMIDLTTNDVMKEVSREEYKIQSELDRVYRN